MLREILSTFLPLAALPQFHPHDGKAPETQQDPCRRGCFMIDLARIILYLQPQLLILTIPMAMLLSVLLVYGRMNVDNEIVIMRGSGMSFRSISQPVAYIGSGCFIVSVLMSFYVGPLASTLLREKVTEVLTVRAPLTIEEGIFNTSFRDIIILVRSKPAPDMLSGIFIVDDRKKDEQKIITAREGRIVPGKDRLSFTLSDGHVYITKKNVFTEIRFGSYHFQLNPSTEQSGRRRANTPPGAASGIPAGARPGDRLSPRIPPEALPAGDLHRDHISRPPPFAHCGKIGETGRTDDRAVRLCRLLYAPAIRGKPRAVRLSAPFRRRMVPLRRPRRCVLPLFDRTNRRWEKDDADHPEALSPRVPRRHDGPRCLHIPHLQPDRPRRQARRLPPHNPETLQMLLCASLTIPRIISTCCLW
ncbi:MAG: LptF/LptG family permease [Desulfobacterales bacterium]|nr:LptF/LptG family permease [Desulfobacterales bacterium]